MRCEGKQQRSLFPADTCGDNTTRTKTCQCRIGSLRISIMHLELRKSHEHAVRKKVSSRLSLSLPKSQRENAKQSMPLSRCDRSRDGIYVPCSVEEV